MNLKIKTTKYSINKVTLSGIFIFNANCIRIVCNNQRWSREHKARGQGQGHKKKSEAKAKDSLSEDRLSRGQGQECSRPRPRTKDTSASALQKKKKRSSQNFLGDLQKKKVFTKIFEDRPIFEDLRPRGQGQGLDLRGQGLQNVSSRPRTSSRTPPLVTIDS